MGALQEMKLANSSAAIGDIRIINAYFWNWYLDHSGDTIIKKKILVFSVTIKVRDLHGLFVQLFGDNANGTLIR